MGFQIQTFLTDQLYDWVNNRNDTSNDQTFSKCSITKAGKYLVASAAHLGMLILTPLWIGISAIFCLGYIFFAIGCENLSCMADAGTEFLYMTAGNSLMLALHILGVAAPFAAEKIYYEVSNRFSDQLNESTQ